MLMKMRTMKTEMEPTGTNRYTFGGKERVSLGGLNQYDFGPRMLNAAAGVWGAPDRMAEKYYGISPYSYCAGNPVKYTDPTGEIIEGNIADWKKLKIEIKDLMSYLDSQIKAMKEDMATRGWISDTDREALSDLQDRYKMLQITTAGMETMEGSNQTYNLTKESPGQNNNWLAYNKDTGKVDIHYDSFAQLVHETTHGIQIENGQVAIVNGNLDFYDLNDESQAFMAQYAFEPASVKSIVSNREITSLRDITDHWVYNIRLQNVYTYRKGLGLTIGKYPISASSPVTMKWVSYPLRLLRKE